MENFKIWVYGLQKETVVSILEKMRDDGVMWRGGHTPGAFDYSTWLSALFVCDGVLTRLWGRRSTADDKEYFDGWNDGREITADEFLHGVGSVDFNEDEFLCFLAEGGGDG